MSYASERERDEGGKFVKPSNPSTFDRDQYRKDYYQKNREKRIKFVVEWGRRNKEKRKVARDKWRAKNTERTNYLRRLYHYRKKNAAGTVSLQEIQKMYRELPVCPYCNQRPSNTVDHVVPLSRGGTNDESNLIPACVSCNSQKGAKTLWEWRPWLALQLESIHG